MTARSIAITLLAVALCAVRGALAYADEAPVLATSSPQQAQARQFGIFVGGTASQYDLCVKKGFLSKGNQSAEEIAKSILEKMRESSQDSEQSAYIQDGWDMMKKEISEHESFFTQQKCASVGKEWAKIVATMKKK